MAMIKKLCWSRRKKLQRMSRVKRSFHRRDRGLYIADAETASGTVKVLVEGLQRARISALSAMANTFLRRRSIWSRRPLMSGTGSAGAYCNQPVRRLHQADKKIPPEVLTSLNSIDDPARRRIPLLHICR